MAAEAAVAAKHTKRLARKGKTIRDAKPKMTKEERRKKYTDIARKRRQKQNGIRRGDSTKSFVCYNCRLPGHNAAECPSLNGAGKENQEGICTPVSKDGTTSSIICYKCGSTEHALRNCPKRHRGDRSDLPFATCFICSKRGHLASACPQNKTGIYVNGGSCRNCGSQQHLASDCPERKKKSKMDESKNERDAQALIDCLLPIEDEHSSRISKTRREMKEQKKLSSPKNQKEKKRVVNF
mmetsp:Transcript_17155/g.39622  ORF Transcript_17155/g.39622 Transcript_17155/m.39622 type:complete len:239 (+) Transcript_17155:125-841(+)|eukprot:CAMPEP_0197186034 /NCGR_PEP_ID=MMETSP1423-20130617/13077_1 /TAXON_ID=476441 /ORGANISM="Pseudo-nitzschia heimii, Strain UNC1101" /LENGTH=238 /DNA_ID=CAMNT_0042637233 /DNA_START=38 /DNA_END=754 /DNA_ORIENTATION=+